MRPSGIDPQQKNFEFELPKQFNTLGISELSYLIEKQIHTLKMLQGFQSTLDLHTLLHLLFKELKAQHGLDGARYNCPIPGHNFSTGDTNTHKLEFTLDTSTDQLGKISLYKKNQFSTTTQEQIHNVLTLFLPALKNAIAYLDALIKSLTCPLTKFKNRLAFDEALQREIAFSKRHHTALSIIVLDIDNFKNVNDTYGHAVGDQILVGLAQILMQSKRHTDMIFRYGGEEFILLLNYIPKVGVFKTAERLRKSIEHNSFPFRDESLKITISLGISHYNFEDTDNMFFEKADQALYLAKENGRNRTFEHKEDSI
jgi:diguanylate cyclase (GGDEF)-like protein